MKYKFKYLLPWVLLSICAVLVIGFWVIFRNDGFEKDVSSPKGESDLIKKDAPDIKNDPFEDTGRSESESASETNLESAPGKQSAEEIEKRLRLAQDAMNRKAYDKAVIFLSGIFESAVDAETRIKIGMLLYDSLIHSHDYEAALDLGFVLKKSNLSSEENLRITQQNAALLFQLDRFEEAENELLTEIKNTKNDSARAQLQAQLQGLWLQIDGRTDEVIQTLSDRLSEEPNDIESLKLLGDLYLNSQRDFVKARVVFERIHKLDAEDRKTQNLLLSIYRKEEDYDAIRRIYESQLNKAEGDDCVIHQQIALIDLQAGRGDEAVEYAEKSLGNENATPFELELLATVYAKSGRPEMAVTTLNEAVERSVEGIERTNLLFTLAGLYSNEKNFEKAEGILRVIIEGNQSDPKVVGRAKSEIFRIYQMQGKLGELNL